MKITVLQNSGYQPANTGWRLSRDGNADVSKLPEIDAPVNDLPSMLLHFEDFTIIEREIFFSARNHVAWARTSRVDDPLLFKVPPALYNEDIHEHIGMKMNACKHGGQTQDQWRMLLPLVSTTSWVARMSYRDVAKMYRYFIYLYLNDEIQSPLRQRFLKICNFLVRIAAEFLDMVSIDNFQVVKFLNNFPLVKLLNEGAFFTDGYNGDSFTAITLKMSFALRAQLIRHKDVHFIDNFFDVLCAHDFRKRTLGDAVIVQAFASNAAWSRILTNRACWIAQADLWQPIVNLFSDHIPLPCDENNACPYAADAQKRVEGTDPGAPCPRYCNLNGIDKIPFRLHMQLEASKRGAAKRGFWEKQIGEAV